MKFKNRKSKNSQTFLTPQIQKQKIGNFEGKFKSENPKIPKQKFLGKFKNRKTKILRENSNQKIQKFQRFLITSQSKQK